MSRKQSIARIIKSARPFEWLVRLDGEPILVVKILGPMPQEAVLQVVKSTICAYVKALNIPIPAITYRGKPVFVC